MTDKDLAFLEDRFRKDMIGLYEIAKRELHYNASYFIQMVAEYGGVKTAQKLLGAPNPSSGFAMFWEHQRLDLSVEALVLRSEYFPLFTDRERDIARTRLAEYGYKQ